MKRHERILERRRIFKQQLLRPLAAMMYYKIGVSDFRYKEKMPIDRKEDYLMQKIEEGSNSYHDFLQSHEFTHHESLSQELLDMLRPLAASIRELGAYYLISKTAPPLFSRLAASTGQIRREIEKFSEFEKINAKYRGE